MNRFSKLVGFVLVVLCVAPVLAQDACPTIVQQALTAADQACQSLKRNQACYGNVQMTAQPQDNVTDFKFQASGDIVDVAKIKTLTLSPLDTKTNQWGVALMKLQADLPDTVPGQNVTVVLFGNVEITNNVSGQPAPILLDISAKNAVNVRATPSTSGAVVGSLTAGQTFKADGRTDKSDWVRVELDGGTVGWVAVRVITITGDISTLPVKDANDTQPAAPAYRPMQSFYFKSGVGDAPCAEAPDSGILIQTPQGADKINLNINGVDVQLGSTGYFQAQPGKEMDMSIIEGQGRVTAKGASQVVPAGARVGIPMDANLQPAGTPGALESYDDKALQPLPVSLLERKVTVAPALTADQLKNALVIVPVPGKWKVVYTNAKASGAGCPPGMQEGLSIALSRQMGTTVDITSNFNMADYFTHSGAVGISGLKVTSSQPGTYDATFSTSGASVHFHMVIVSSTSIQGTVTMTIPGGCTITLDMQMSPV